jgi:hypothetical protein
MVYPKWVYSRNVDVTRENKRQYEAMYHKWYDKAFELYPNYSSLNLKERIEARKAINKAVGYEI